jgi:hypothetical protein
MTKLKSFTQSGKAGIKYHAKQKATDAAVPAPFLIYPIPHTVAIAFERLIIVLQ